MATSPRYVASYELAATRSKTRDSVTPPLRRPWRWRWRCGGGRGIGLQLTVLHMVRYVQKSCIVFEATPISVIQYLIVDREAYFAILKLEPVKIDVNFTADAERAEIYGNFRQQKLIPKKTKCELSGLLKLVHTVYYFIYVRQTIA
jgi:hypothetical protein